ncbi:helix-turn-helix transcriptional regulator [Aestuariispira insulae]|uniref:Cro/C1-type helix-turn-helix DNA-binding protein n=1 Tax=Aestuariispira insulae TaxID=1461337 RepID=A0A3D9H568_9PROT|nr:helix-turn-helix transcriptional regulator [Aestuariispira insulae]RED44655.1 Cro/C1-type helix-turn-helix DNA-binding protein [Aestuariispira insulae]
MTENLTENLRLLCSYGKSTSDICRRAGINRQQFSKYLNGHTQPSLATLRILCDFFGVEESELFLPAPEFRKIVQLRPPRFEKRESHFDKIMNHMTDSNPTGRDMLQRHEGYYHSYLKSYPQQELAVRALSHIYKREDRWFIKTIERRLDEQFLLPSTLKYEGYVSEGCNRICIQERECGTGRSIGTTFLYPSEHARPTYLSGVMVGFSTEGSQDITCSRTIWHYLGPKPNLRQALNACGVVDPDQEQLPDFVRYGISNDLEEGETVLMPRY